MARYQIVRNFCGDYLAESNDKEIAIQIAKHLSRERNERVSVIQAEKDTIIYCWVNGVGSSCE